MSPDDREIALLMKNVTKSYFLYKSDNERLKAMLFPQKYQAPKFLALNDVNLELYKGEILGVIGLNGSGKSTLASVIAGVTYADSGEVIVNGEVSMLSAQSGLNMSLTGQQNITNKCTLMGFSKKYIHEIENEIVEFAELGNFIDQPLRTYSSGMRSRLGFAISIHTKPDILIIDESLAVGDLYFVDKCFEKMHELKISGKTIIYVSHSVMQMKGFCDSLLWLHKGKQIEFGAIDEIITNYNSFVRQFNKMSAKQREVYHPSVPEINY